MVLRKPVVACSCGTWHGPCQSCHEHGGTVATGPLTHSDCGEGRGGFGDDRIWKTYASSDLAVLHVQFVSIRGWLEHYIRGATTYNYTRRDVNCDTVGRG